MRQVFFHFRIILFIAKVTINSDFFEFVTISKKTDNTRRNTRRSKRKIAIPDFISKV